MGLEFEYDGEFEAAFETVLGYESGGKPEGNIFVIQLF
jgi:hypothetical protein